MDEFPQLFVMMHKYLLITTMDGWGVVQLKIVTSLTNLFNSYFKWI